MNIHKQIKNALLFSVIGMSSFGFAMDEAQGLSNNQNQGQNNGNHSTDTIRRIEDDKQIRKNLGSIGDFLSADDYQQENDNNQSASQLSAEEKPIIEVETIIVEQNSNGNNDQLKSEENRGSKKPLASDTLQGSISPKEVLDDNSKQNDDALEGSSILFSEDESTYSNQTNASTLSKKLFQHPLRKYLSFKNGLIGGGIVLGAGVCAVLVKKMVDYAKSAHVDKEIAILKQLMQHAQEEFAQFTAKYEEYCDSLMLVSDVEKDYIDELIDNKDMAKLVTFLNKLCVKLNKKKSTIPGRIKTGIAYDWARIKYFVRGALGVDDYYQTAVQDPE